MNVQITVDGTDITTSVISYERVHKLCSGVGTFTFSYKYNCPKSITIGDLVVLREAGDKKGTYYVKQIDRSAEGGFSTAECQDYSFRLMEYFLVDSYYTGSELTMASYWIERFCNEAGVSPIFDDMANDNYVNTNTTFGLASVYDTIVPLIAQCGWYMYFDEDGDLHIGPLVASSMETEHVFSDSIVLSIKTNLNDRYLRNRAVIWGNSSSTDGGQIFADMSTNTPWNYNDSDYRTVVIDNVYVPDNDTAYEIAKKVLDEFSVIYEEVEIVMAGANDVTIATTGKLKSKFKNITGVVTTVMSNMTSSGLITTVILNERCPRIYAYFSNNYYYGIEYVYVGTAANGVWRKPLAGPHVWEDFSDGLEHLDVTDLNINNGLFVCVAGGILHYRDIDDVAWTPFHPTQGFVDSLNLVEYDLGDVECVACSIDNATNTILGAYCVEGQLTFTNGEPSGTDLHSWIIKLEGLTYTVIEVINADGNNFHVFDVDTDTKDIYLSVLTPESWNVEMTDVFFLAQRYQGMANPAPSVNSANQLNTTNLTYYDFSWMWSDYSYDYSGFRWVFTSGDYVYDFDWAGPYDETGHYVARKLNFKTNTVEKQIDLPYDANYQDVGYIAEHDGKIFLWTYNDYTYYYPEVYMLDFENQTYYFMFRGGEDDVLVTDLFLTAVVKDRVYFVCYEVAEDDDYDQPRIVYWYYDFITNIISAKTKLCDCPAGPAPDNYYTFDWDADSITPIISDDGVHSLLPLTTGGVLGYPDKICHVVITKDYDISYRFHTLSLDENESTWLHNVGIKYSSQDIYFICSNYFYVSGGGHNHYHSHYYCFKIDTNFSLEKFWDYIRPHSEYTEVYGGIISAENNIYVIETTTAYTTAKIRNLETFELIADLADYIDFTYIEDCWDYQHWSLSLSKDGKFYWVSPTDWVWVWTSPTSGYWTTDGRELFEITLEPSFSVTSLLEYTGLDYNRIELVNSALSEDKIITTDGVFASSDTSTSQAGGISAFYLDRIAASGVQEIGELPSYGKVECSKDFPVIAYGGNTVIPSGAFVYVKEPDTLDANGVTVSGGLTSITLPDTSYVGCVRNLDSRYTWTKEILHRQTLFNQPNSVSNYKVYMFEYIPFAATPDIEDKFVFMSGVGQLETSNKWFSYTPYYFVSLSGEPSAFYQRNADAAVFNEYSVNLPGSNITIIRLDDRI